MAEQKWEAKPSPFLLNFFFKLKRPKDKNYRRRTIDREAEREAERDADLGADLEARDDGSALRGRLAAAVAAGAAERRTRGTARRPGCVLCALDLDAPAPARPRPCRK